MLLLALSFVIVPAEQQAYSHSSLVLLLTMLLLLSSLPIHIESLPFNQSSLTLIATSTKISRADMLGKLHILKDTIIDAGSYLLHAALHSVCNYIFTLQNTFSQKIRQDNLGSKLYIYY